MCVCVTPLTANFAKFRSRIELLRLFCISNSKSHVWGFPQERGRETLNVDTIFLVVTRGSPRQTRETCVNICEIKKKQKKNKIARISISFWRINCENLCLSVFLSSNRVKYKNRCCKSCALLGRERYAAKKLKAECGRRRFCAIFQTISRY